MDARRLRELELIVRLLKSLSNTVLGLCPAAAQAALQRVQRRRRNENVSGVIFRLLDLLDSLFFTALVHPTRDSRIF